MARPSPTVIMEAVDPVTFKTEQILLADAVYSVYYDDVPVNIKVINKLADTPAKYKKTSFQNSGYALHLAKRLNALFKTDKFIVRKMNGGEVYTGEAGFYDE